LRCLERQHGSRAHTCIVITRRLLPTVSTCSEDVEDCIDQQRRGRTNGGFTFIKRRGRETIVRIQVVIRISVSSTSSQELILRPVHVTAHTYAPGNHERVSLEIRNPEHATAHAYAPCNHESVSLEIRNLQKPSMTGCGLIRCVASDFKNEHGHIRQDSIASISHVAWSDFDTNVSRFSCDCLAQYCHCARHKSDQAFSKMYISQVPIDRFVCVWHCMYSYCSMTVKA